MSNHRLTKADLAAIAAEVDARAGARPDASEYEQRADWLQQALEAISGAGRVLTLLVAEVVQAGAALIIAVVFAVLEFQRVEAGAVALEQPHDKAALIAFAVVTANIVHPIYSLREMRGKAHVTVTVGTLRGALVAFWRRIIGQPVSRELDAYHNPTLHIAAAMITWTTILLAIYDVLGPLLQEMFSPAGLQRPIAIAAVELVAGLGLSIAGVFFLQSAAHEIGVRTLVDAPVSAQQRLDHAMAQYDQRRNEVWHEVQQRYLDAKDMKDKASVPPDVPFGHSAAAPVARVSIPMIASANGTGGIAKAQMLDEIKESSRE